MFYYVKFIYNIIICFLIDDYPLSLFDPGTFSLPILISGHHFPPLMIRFLCNIWSTRSTNIKIKLYILLEISKLYLFINLKKQIILWQSLEMYFKLSKVWKGNNGFTCTYFLLKLKKDVKGWKEGTTQKENKKSREVAVTAFLMLEVRRTKGNWSAEKAEFSLSNRKPDARREAGLFIQQNAEIIKNYMRYPWRWGRKQGC